MAGKLILFQGDSITDGNRYKEKSQEWDLNHQIGHAYPYAIVARLGSEYPEKHFSFLNRGISGNTVAQLYGRWKADVLIHKPDVLSVLIGVNDLCSVDVGGSDPKRFEKIYRLLLDESIECNPHIKFILLEPFLLPVGKRSEDWDAQAARLEPYRLAVARIAGDYGAVFVPLQQKFLDLCAVREPSYWIWDGVHPTEPGHGIIAAEWMRHAADILELQ